MVVQHVITRVMLCFDSGCWGTQLSVVFVLLKLNMVLCVNYKTFSNYMNIMGKNLLVANNENCEILFVWSDKILM